MDNNNNGQPEQDREIVHNEQYDVHLGVIIEQIIIGICIS